MTLWIWMSVWWATSVGATVVEEAAFLPQLLGLHSFQRSVRPNLRHFPYLWSLIACCRRLHYWEFLSGKLDGEKCRASLSCCVKVESGKAIRLSSPDPRSASATPEVRVNAIIKAAFNIFMIDSFCLIAIALFLIKQQWCLNKFVLGKLLGRAKAKSCPVLQRLYHAPSVV